MTGGVSVLKLQNMRLIQKPAPTTKSRYLRSVTGIGYGLVNGVLSSMWTRLSLRFSRLAREEIFIVKSMK